MDKPPKRIGERVYPSFLKVGNGWMVFLLITLACTPVQGAMSHFFDPRFPVLRNMIHIFNIWNIGDRLDVFTSPLLIILVDLASWSSHQEWRSWIINSINISHIHVHNLMRVFLVVGSEKIIIHESPEGFLHIISQLHVTCK